MSKALILAEKPSVGRDIARVLNCSMKGNGHAEGSKYIVTWAMGHLVTLATPEKYNQSYGEWRLESLPMVPKPFKLEVIKGTSKQYHLVRKLLDRQDVTEVIIATDAGREGELVARWILSYAHCKKPIKRLWISSVTDKAIKEGFNHLKDGRLYNNLYYAAKARAEADWILGLNGTRALTVKHNASLSMGRVQTPTLNLIAEREKEIRAFKPKTFNELEGDVSSVRFKALDLKSGQSRIYQKETAEDMLKTCKSGEFKVQTVKEQVKSINKTGFYDLTELQRDANKQFGFSAKETLNTMQSLYERHKVLTYPRTDSKYITLDVVETLKDRLRACKTSNNKKAVSILLKQEIKASPTFADNKKVGDHHGIIPTEEQPDYNGFSPKERKIYNMVVQRFIEALLPPYKYKEVTIEARIKDITLRGKTTETIDLGWKMAKGDFTEAATKKETVFIEGRSYKPSNWQLKQGKTVPPSYLDEGELLHQMEKADLGTVATRADIIEKIISNNYVDKVGKELKVTKTGKQLLNLVPKDMTSKELTAKWEQDLEKIAKGQKKDKDFMDDLIDFTHKVISEIKADQRAFKYDNVSSETCPDCGKKLLMISNKHGKRLVCRDRECGYKKNVSKITNARCPNCHKKMEMVGQGENQTFVCKCGHKEKLSAFNKRKQSSGGKVSKRDVQKYMNKNKKENEVFNNPFASLLKDLDEE